MPIVSHQFLGLAVDPIHIGTGSERIGRVDMTIVRDPATNVPFVPGSGISGAMKFYADTDLRERGMKTNICASDKGSDRENAHNQHSCPICCAFGFTPPSEEDGASAKGILDFEDALILAYPVPTVDGPVWLTTKPRLKDYLDLTDGEDIDKDGYQTLRDSTVQPISTTLPHSLNFGWVVLPHVGNAGIAVEDLKAAAPLSTNVARRTAVVPEWLFSHFVNDHLDIRTSVVMNPDTGSAKKGGLFTYEAIARGTIFAFSITDHDYGRLWQAVQNSHDNIPATAMALLEQHAFNGLAHVGLGGMTTRGFGRLAVNAFKERAGT